MVLPTQVLQQKVVTTAILSIPQLISEFPTTRYIMPSFTNTLVGVGPICDAYCTVVFTKKYVTVFSPKGNPILKGWREKKLPRLWSFSMLPTEEFLMHYTPKRQTTPSAHSAYDLPSAEEIVRYMHAASRFSFKSMWIREIKQGGFESWPGLTCSNTAKYCPC